MKKIWLIIFMLWIVCANICGCGKKDNTGYTDDVCYNVSTKQLTGYAEEKDVVILPEESFLSDFEVIGNEVHIYCVVSLENQGSDSKTIKLSGDFQNEVNTGLLTSNSLEAHFVKENADTITLAGNSDAKYVEIEFVGEYAGTSVMSSKALPGITVLSEE